MIYNLDTILCHLCILNRRYDTDHCVVILSSQWREEDIPVLFEKEDEIIYTDTTELSVLCKELGIYPSSSAARKAGRVGSLPTGWSEIKASRKDFLFVWNPDE